MKKTFLLITLASTSISGVAMAGFCADKSDYKVSVSGVADGTVTFTPSDVVGSSYAGIYDAKAVCGYAMKWKNPVAGAQAASASCNVAQASVYGQSVCAAGTKAPSPDAITAPLLSVSGCQGFDTGGVVQAVSFMLSGGGEGCVMNGIARYSLYPYAMQAITFE
jgi:hypothetical protein